MDLNRKRFEARQMVSGSQFVVVFWAQDLDEAEVKWMQTICGHKDEYTPEELARCLKYEIIEAPLQVSIPKGVASFLAQCGSRGGRPRRKGKDKGKKRKRLTIDSGAKKR